MSGMGNFGYATLQLIPSLKGAAAEIQKQLGGSDVQAGTKKSGSVVGGALIGGLKGVLKSTVAGGALFAGIAVKGGISRLLNIEDARAKLLGLGNDTKTVDGIMKNALASVKGTAFGLDSAATVAAGAVASGVKPGKDLERTLKLVADAATIAGVPLSDMGSIFNKVAANGKLQGDVIAQLGDKGIPILQMLGKALGKTPAEVSKLAAQGKIDFATFQNAMEQGLGGAALKSGDTTRGAFKNMLASVSRIGANFLSGVFPLFQKTFSGITKILAPVEDGAKKAGAGLIALGTAIASKVGPILDKAKIGLEAFKSAFSGEGITSDGFVGAMERIGVATRQVFDYIVTKGIPALKELGAKVVSTVVPAVQNLWKFVGPLALDIGKLAISIGQKVLPVALALAKSLGGGLLDAVKGLSQFIGDNATFFQALAVSVGTAVVAFKAYQGIIAAASFVKGLKAIVTSTRLWTVAQAALNLVMSANPVALVVIAIAALVAGLIYAFKHSKKFHDGVISAFNGVKAVVGAVVGFFTDTLAPAFVKAWDAVAGFFTKTLPGAFSSAWGAITGFFSAARDKIAGVISAIVGAVSAGLGFIGGVISTVLAPAFAIWRAIWGLFGPLITAVFNLIGATVGLAIAAIQYVIGNALKFIYGTWVAIWNAVSSFVSTVWSGITKAVTSAATAVANFVVSKVTALKNGAVKVFNDFLAGVRIIWAAISKAISTVAGAIWSKISGPLNAIKTGAVNVFNNVLAGVRSVWNSISSAVTNVAKAIWGKISGPINSVKTGVSNAFNSAKDLGVRAFNSLLSGVGSIAGKIGDKVSSIVSKIKGVFSGAGNILKNAGRAIIQGLIDGITSKISELTGKLDQLTTYIKDHKGPIEKDRRLLIPAGQAIMDSLVLGFQSKFPAVKSALGGITNDLGRLPISSAANAGLVGSPASRGADGRAVQITVNGQNDPEATARIVGRKLAGAGV